MDKTIYQKNSDIYIDVLNDTSKVVFDSKKSIFFADY